MMQLDFDNEVTELAIELSKYPVGILATSYLDKVTARSISIIAIGTKILFQTDSRMEKCQQIEKNNNVAICMI